MNRYKYRGTNKDQALPPLSSTEGTTHAGGRAYESLGKQDTTILRISPTTFEAQGKNERHRGQQRGDQGETYPRKRREHRWRTHCICQVVHFVLSHRGTTI